MFSIAGIFWSELLYSRLVIERVEPFLYFILRKIIFNKIMHEGIDNCTCLRWMRFFKPRMSYEIRKITNTHERIIENGRKKWTPFQESVRSFIPWHDLKAHKNQWKNYVFCIFEAEVIKLEPKIQAVLWIQKTNIMARLFLFLLSVSTWIEMLGK